MKTNKSGTSSGSRLREALLFGFLALSIVSAVVIVSCHDDMSTFMEPPSSDPVPSYDEPVSVVGGSASSHAISVLFEATAEGAASTITEAGLGWALGALGLAEESPDYTEQFEKIDEDLQEIIGQLQDITNELDIISSELRYLNCDLQVNNIDTKISRIHTLFNRYRTHLSTATDTTFGNTADTTINAIFLDWADQVLAQGIYQTNEQGAMDEILQDIATTLYRGGDGALKACIATIERPGNPSFNDTVYYDQVSHYTQYYYYYQAVGLFMLTEAAHYKAWVASGSPTDLSADSVSFICQNPVNLTVKDYCNQAITATNQLYNDLIDQFTTGGAPYTNEYFLMTILGGSPHLWIRSLEDFSTAAKDNCNLPLTSVVNPDSDQLYPCGTTVGFYDTPYPSNFSYRGYKNLGYAGNNNLADILTGWSSGKAGDFLEERGFKNMKNKLIIAFNTTEITLDHSDMAQQVVNFIDTDIDYSFNPHSFQRDSDFNKIAPFTQQGKICGYMYTMKEIYTMDWRTANFLPDRNGFYHLHGHKGYPTLDCNQSSANIDNDFTWLEKPGWLASFRGNPAKQFRWPGGQPFIFTDYCTEGRSPKNVNGAWSMCGDDYHAWFENIVPRPETCNNPSTLITCKL